MSARSWAERIVTSARVPDAFEVALVGGDELADDADGRVAPLAAVLPGVEEGFLGLEVDLFAGPLFEVGDGGGDDFFALTDLVAVGALVGDEGLGVEEGEDGVGERIVGPRDLTKGAHGGLVAVERHAELGLANEAARPFGVIAFLLRFFTDLGGEVEGGLHLLFVLQTVDFLPGCWLASGTHRAPAAVECSPGSVAWAPMPWCRRRRRRWRRLCRAWRRLMRVRGLGVRGCGRIMAIRYFGGRKKNSEGSDCRVWWYGRAGRWELRRPMRAA